jgi:hypothetical protein
MVLQGVFRKLHVKIIHLLGEFFFYSADFILIYVTNINYIQLERGENFLSIDSNIYYSWRVYRRDIGIDILYRFS